MAKIREKKETNLSISSNVSRKNEDRNPFDKRAKRKFLNRSIAAPLIALESASQKQYIKQYWCEHNWNWSYDKEKYVSKYCKTRLCTGCQNIKTAELIKRFEKALRAEKDLYFSTLTVVNPPVEETRTKIKEMNSNWRKITVLAKMTGIELSGLKKLECTHSEIYGDYHPHYHLLVVGEENARFIQDHWLRLNPTSEKEFSPYTKADENTIKELLKYVTKVFKKDKNDKNSYKVNINAIDFINETLKGVRTFESFGKFRNMPEPELTPAEIEHAYYGDSFTWAQELSTWTGENHTRLSENEYYKKLKIRFK